MRVCIVAFIHAKISFCCIIVAKSHDRFRTAVCPIRDTVIRCMIGIISNTVHTTCSCTVDTAEDFFWCTFCWNQEGTTLYGNGAITIEWVFYPLTTLKTTSCTTTVNLSNLYTAIDILILVIFRLCRVYQDVGASHIGVVRCIVKYIVIYCFSSCTQRTISHTSYLSTLDNDVNIANHSSLMVACKNYGNVKVRIVIIMIIVEITVDIYINSTLDRHVRATHHTISVVRSLSATCTN